jgi:hypothetical protein
MLTGIMYQEDFGTVLPPLIRVRLEHVIPIAGRWVKQFVVRNVASTFSVMLSIVMSTALLAQVSPRGLEQVLPRVQDHVDEFAHNLPDFICDETITSRELEGAGKVRNEVVVESEFKGRQNKVENGKSFIESREIKTMNGKPVRPDQQLIGPFFYSGGFSSILVAVLSRENEPYFNHTISGAETLAGRPALLLKFETRRGQKRLLYHDLFHHQSYLKGKGKAWIDPESMNVLRLEFHYQDSGGAIGGLDVSVNYAPVTILDKTFWMPQLVTANQSIPGRAASVRYNATYSNYHHFNVSIRFD